MAYRWEFDLLVAKLQEVETLAHSVGLHATAHAINEAKNRAGWEFAGVPPPDRNKPLLNASEPERAR